MGLLFSGSVFCDDLYPGKGNAAGENRRGGGVYDAPQMQLSARGENVENSLRQMREYGAVTVEKAVIMPNHIHLLLAVRACANGSS